MTAILYPVFVQVALTFALLMWMGFERFKAVRAGTVQRGGHGGAKPVWPERAAVVSNAFHNQLEVPMLFYTAAAFAMLGGAVDTLLVGLAWAFVLLRLVHAAIHTTYNHVPHRFLAYLAGVTVLMVIWFRIFLHVAQAGI